MSDMDKNKLLCDWLEAEMNRKRAQKESDKLRARVYELESALKEINEYFDDDASHCEKVRQAYAMYCIAGHYLNKREP